MNRLKLAIGYTGIEIPVGSTSVLFLVSPLTVTTPSGRLKLAWIGRQTSTTNVEIR